MKAYTQNETILGLVETLRREKLNEKVYSDIVDEAGYQYADLVQEGGGVLGIALVGYTYMMEQAGIRFFSLAGTSAGAINAMMMAGMSPVGEPVSEKILHMLSEQNLFDFVDGHKRLKRLVQRYIDGRGGIVSRIVLNIRRILKTLNKHLGINPGIEFQKWIDTHLEYAGIFSLADLEGRRQKLPRLLDRESRDQVQRVAELKIIASDITTKSKITFPQMAPLYWDNPQQQKPSCFVRASMSIPFFFYPFVIKKIPGAGTREDAALPKEETLWRQYTGYQGVIPSEVHFVDGGMLSNFPIHAFHRKGRPSKPTFGARLSTWRQHAKPISGMGAMAGAMISTMRQLHDYDFLLKNDDYKHLICSIDCDAQTDARGNVKYNWLDFNMKEKQKVELFNLGAAKALEFLRDFSWEDYRDSRG